MSTDRRTRKQGADSATGGRAAGAISTEPFWWPGGKIGCLLVHGFTGTPYEMRYLGQKLHACGHSVYGVRLTGHGSGGAHDPEMSSWRDWYASVERGLDRLAEHCSAVVPIGLSLGGLLSLQLASERPQAVAALVLLSPALVLSSPWPARLAPFLELLLRFLPGAFRALPKRGSDISDPGARSVHPGSAVIPLRGLVELIRLQELVRRGLDRVRQPAIALQGGRDRIVSAEGLTLLQNKLANLRRTVILPDSSHVITVDVERERVAAEAARFIEEVLGAKAAPRRSSSAGAP